MPSVIKMTIKTFLRKKYPSVCNPGSRQNTSEGHTMYLFNKYEKPETYNIDSFDNYLRIRYNNLDKDYLIYSMELLNYKHRIYL